jgi:RNA polymerase-binding protein DksA
MNDECSAIHHSSFIFHHFAYGTLPLGAATMTHNQGDLARFWVRLVEIRDSLRSEIESRDEETQRTTQDSDGFGVTNHPADDATDIFDRERNMAVEAEMQRELAQVERALSRFEAGTYGLCEVCEQPIGEERLEARPSATLCIVHQREQDSQTYSVPDTQY